MDLEARIGRYHDEYEGQRSQVAIQEAVAATMQHVLQSRKTRSRDADWAQPKLAQCPFCGASDQPVRDWPEGAEVYCAICDT